MTDLELIEAIDEDGEGLTAWEIDFVDRMLKRSKLPRSSVASDFMTRGSGSQREKAEQIYDERCP